MIDRERLFDLHEEVCSEALQLMRKKTQDYSGGSDSPLRNSYGSKMFGVEPEVGLMIRMNDKFQRVHAFLSNGTLAVQEENIADIARDLINYSVLLYGLLLDRVEVFAQEATLAEKMTPNLSRHEYLGEFVTTLTQAQMTSLGQMIQGWAGDTVIPLRLDKMIEQIKTGKPPRYDTRDANMPPIIKRCTVCGHRPHGNDKCYKDCSCTGEL